MLHKRSLISSVIMLIFTLVCGCSKKNESGVPPTAAQAQIEVTSGLVNPGFESGSLSPWTPYLDPKASLVKGPVHGGQFSLAEDGVGSVWQDVSGLDAGTTYTISAWVSAAPGAAASASIGVFNPATNVSKFSDRLVPTQGWQLLKYSVLLDKGNTFRIHLYRPEGSGTVYWDDVRLYYEK
jgi:endo-alpha-N-acetylgalactosaminidase